MSKQNYLSIYSKTNKGNLTGSKSKPTEDTVDKVKPEPIKEEPKELIEDKEEPKDFGGKWNEWADKVGAESATTEDMLSIGDDIDETIEETTEEENIENDEIFSDQTINSIHVDKKQEIKIMSDDLGIPNMDMFSDEETMVDTVIKDECEHAFNTCFVGGGQGGGRLAEAFWKLGYRKVCAINTSSQDLNSLDIPEENKLLIDTNEGAGKNPRKGKEAISKNKEKVYALMQRCFGTEFDRIIVSTCAGGGTGTGVTKTLLELARDMHESFNIKDEPGLIVSLPQVKEGKTANENAWVLLNDLYQQVDEKKLSPMFIVDNDRIFSVYGKSVAVNKFWTQANLGIASLIHTFNVLATKDSNFSSFDKADLKTVMDSGIIIVGATPIRKWDRPEDISEPISESFSKSILAEGFDLTKATHSCLVLVAGSDVLNEVSMDTMNYAFEALDRIIGRKAVLHRGIYETKGKGMMAYCMIGGLQRPDERMEQIKKIAER